MLELTSNQLVFKFPEVHPDAQLVVTLHRTFRLPDDGKKYPLPPSLGFFPVKHVDDFAAKIPKKWVGRGGVMVPLYQSEAMWLQFHPQLSRLHRHHYPFAVKIATGKCSAITGKKWSKKLKADDYLVCPEQPWLDGYVVEDGTVRQFVAAPLGLGITAEEQITGKAEFGGLQIEVVPMDPEKFAKRYPPVQEEHNFLRSANMRRRSVAPSAASHGGGKFGSYGIPGVYTSTLSKESKTSGSTNYSCDSIKVLSADEARAKRPEMYAKEIGETATMDYMSLDLERGVDSDELSLGEEVNIDMGLAPGGAMEQQIFKDPYGLADWSASAKTRCFVHMANSLAWEHVTGQRPPLVPTSATQYASKGLPWFSYYEEGASSQSGTEKTKALKGVAEISKEKKIPFLPENQSPTTVKVVPVKKVGQVRDGVWK